MHNNSRIFAPREKAPPSAIQLSFLPELFGEKQPDRFANIISFSEVAEKHRNKMEKKAYTIILDNITHLKEKDEKEPGE